MNLGSVAINAFLAILAVSFIVGLVLAIGLARLQKTLPRPYLAIAVLLVPPIVFLSLYFLHHPLFAAWHRWQNTLVPRTGYVCYEPTATTLCAKYRMDRRAFDEWVAHHPWKPQPSRADWSGDGERLGFDAPEAAYATETAPNGRHLRVYYKDGLMYLLYFAM